MHLRTSILLILLAAFAVVTSACGGGGGASIQPVLPPTFTSVPVSTASEGTTYTYQLAATGSNGAAVTFTLVNAPTGATLSGSTITWTPTAAQARVENTFTVKATTSGGVSSTQTWSVVPDGTIHVTWIDTYWNWDGATDTPFDWRPLSGLAGALVPQPDGSLKSFPGTGGADGNLTIPNVPGGYYWLQAGRFMYWTSASSIDLGADLIGKRQTGLTDPGDATTTTFNFNLSGLESVPSGWMQVNSTDGFIATLGVASGTTTFASSVQVNSNADYSRAKTAFAREYEQVLMGDMNGFVLGPALTLTDLSLTSGTTNNITGTLQPSPAASLNVSIKGSAWPSLFEHVAAGPLYPDASSFSASVYPFMSGKMPSMHGPALDLFGGGVESGTDLMLAWAVRPAACTNVLIASTIGGDFIPSQTTPIVTDLNLGTINYGDPYDSSWQRAFSVCQRAYVPLPSPDLDTTVAYGLTNNVITSLPTAPVGPVISALQNPTINDLNLFTAQTVTTRNPTLKWSVPALGTPYGYEVIVLEQKSQTQGGSGTFTIPYLPVATYGTAKTSMTLPMSLSAGKTYFFVIKAMTDGKANMETSPRRSALPLGNADVISAAITIGQ